MYIRNIQHTYNQGSGSGSSRILVFFRGSVTDSDPGFFYSNPYPDPVFFMKFVSRSAQSTKQSGKSSQNKAGKVHKTKRGKSTKQSGESPFGDPRIHHLYCTKCPGSSDPFYIVSYYIKWVTTSWTHGI